jgi:hypothetical protein
MKTFTRSSLAVIAIMVFAACSPTGNGGSALMSPGQNPYAAQPGDAGMMRGELRIDSAKVSLSQSGPVQVLLHFAYFQPTPCYQLRVETSQPDAQNRIYVSAYAVAERDKPCALMALATPLQADLNLGTFSTGRYSVWLNGEKVGEFDE